MRKPTIEAQQVSRTQPIRVLERVKTLRFAVSVRHSFWGILVAIYALLQITCLRNSTLVFLDCGLRVRGPACTALAFPWRRRRAQMPRRGIPDRYYSRACLCRRGQQEIPGCVSSIFHGSARDVLPSVWRLPARDCRRPSQKPDADESFPVPQRRTFARR